MTSFSFVVRVLIILSKKYSKLNFCIVHLELIKKTSSTKTDTCFREQWMPNYMFLLPFRIFIFLCSSVILYNTLLFLSYSFFFFYSTLYLIPSLSPCIVFHFFALPLFYFFSPLLSLSHLFSPLPLSAFSSASFPREEASNPFNLWDPFERSLL